MFSQKMKYSYTFRNYSCRIREMAQCLRAFMSLTEGPVWFPEPTNAHDCYVWESDALSWPSWTLHAHGANKPMQTNVHNVLEKDLSNKKVLKFSPIIPRLPFLFWEEKVNFIFMLAENDILHFVPRLSMHCLMIKYEKVSLQPLRLG